MPITLSQPCIQTLVWCRAGDKRYTIADVPGLIEGASEGKGLGLEFLRHVERCSALCHVIDCATLENGRDPVSDLKVILEELEKYEVPQGQTPLIERPQVVVLNKIDIPDAKELADFVQKDFEDLGYPVYQVSTATHAGLKELGFALGMLAQEGRSQVTEETSRRFSLLQTQPETSTFSVTREQIGDEEIFRLVGQKPERWVAQTEFGNAEAVGYLAERLHKLGVEDQLTKLGARSGSTVIVGSGDGVVFDWDPMISSLAEMADAREVAERIDPNDRRTNKQRRAEYYEMMDERAKGRAEREAVRESSIFTEEE